MDRVTNSGTKRMTFTGELNIVVFGVEVFIPGKACRRSGMLDQGR